MDDFVISNLNESRNEWCCRLVSIFTPLVIEGFRSIFNESWNMCVDNDEVSKYLMTFQNLLCRVPKWNSIIIEEERKRIIERSGCNYLEDLITCVHIIQLKVLTCIRVGNKQKKIDISIPKLDHFIHKIYIHSARKIYMNIYLFEKNISPLQLQKNNRELEIIIQECILMTIRESIPTEAIIRAYLDESVEHEEDVYIENVEEPVLPKVGQEQEHLNKNNDSNKSDTMNESDIPPEIVPSIKNIDNENVITRLSFNDIDSVLDDTNKVETINAPKTIERLEEISSARAIQRKLEEENDSEDYMNDNIKIFGDNIPLDNIDVVDLNNASSSVSTDVPLFEFEELR
jgi:hypothetical protein